MPEKAARLTQALFDEDHFPKAMLTGKKAHQAFLKGARERVPLPKAKGRVSLEMILPYPPGITVLEPGEVWTDEALSYFLFLQKYKSAFPGSFPRDTGVHGKEAEPYVWVLKNQKRGAKEALIKYPFQASPTFMFATKLSPSR